MDKVDCGLSLLFDDLELIQLATQDTINRIDMIEVDRYRPQPVAKLMLCGPTVLSSKLFASRPDILDV